MEMKLHQLVFLRLLPHWMRGDLAIQGLSMGLDGLIPQLAEGIERLTTWDQIDHLSEEELDELAWELNILWYETDADISIKRDVIKNSDKVYQHLGTKWAVENVIKSYFTTGYIKEWFQYDGQPGRFRVYSENPAITGEKLPSFLNLLYKIKRASAKLDAVWLELESQGTVTFGAASELSGRMELWPLVPREIRDTGTVTHGAGTEIVEKMGVLPQVPRKIDVTGEAATVGGQAWGMRLEIFPQGGTT